MLRNRIYSTSALALFYFIFNCSIANAMAGSDNIDAHINLAQTIEHQEAVGRVVDSELNFLQTGVLISSNIVMTAAHGMQLLLDSGKSQVKDFGAYIAIFPKKMTVSFTLKPGIEVTYSVESIVLDSRYVRFEEGEQHKFDFAFLKLSQKVEDINPLQLNDQIYLEPDMPMVVITWGNSDIPKQNIKRSFYLFEWSLFYPFLDDDALQPLRKVMCSSIFFKPSNQLPEQPSINDTENIQRQYYALKSWFKHGKKPYGLALPGTSGAPVLINTKTGSELFGVVMGYANLGDQKLANIKDFTELAKNPSNIYNLFQTIIATPYRLNTDPEANKTSVRNFVLDKRYSEIIKKLESGEIS